MLMRARTGCTLMVRRAILPDVAAHFHIQYGAAVAAPRAGLPLCFAAGQTTSGKGYTILL